MYCSKPIIVSNVGYDQEAVRNAQCGLVIEPHRPELFAQAVIELLTNDAAAVEMGINGRKAVIERYNWDREKEHLLEIYRGIPALTSRFPL